jgi:hypothetical protein
MMNSGRAKIEFRAIPERLRLPQLATYRLDDCHPPDLGKMRQR